MTHPGATPDEWTHWSVMLGLTQDLLPVVSRADAEISQRSTLKGVGKTPSVYNADGKVVGIAHWTAVHTSDALIEKWSKQHDYGICLQTRSVRAIDIDVDDPTHAATIRAAVVRLLGVSVPPARARPGAPRVVLAYRCDSALAKRVVRLDDAGGAIELLADGQQFIVAGTHIKDARASGRYYWEGGYPAEFPLVGADRLCAALDEIERTYGSRQAGQATRNRAKVLERSGRRAARNGEAGPAADATDPQTVQQRDDGQQGRGSVARDAESAMGRHGADDAVRSQGAVPLGVPRDARQEAAPEDGVVGWLEARGFVRGVGREGEVQIWCPWLEQHTGDSGDTETVYYPARTGGFEGGHFKCLHAHCAHREDSDFLNAIGWHLSMADEIKEISDHGFSTGRRTGVPRDRPDGGSGGQDGNRPAAGAGADRGHDVGDLGDRGAAGVGGQPGSAGGPAPAALHGVLAPELAGTSRALVAEQALEIPDDPIAAWGGNTPGKSLLRSKKGYRATLVNLQRALGTVGWWRRIAYDQFRDELMWCAWGEQPAQWRRWTDEDTTRCRERLEVDGFEPVSKDLMRDAVSKHARDRVFDSAQLWLGRLQWDGVPRVEGFLSRYCGTVAGAYERAVSRYLWTALAGRVLQPGCKADMVPILVGAGGVGKTSLVAALAPSREFFVGVSLHARDADLSRRLRGRLVVELAELRGLRTRDSESVKDFVTLQEEDWVPKWRETNTRLPRRFVLVGTTDKEWFLSDDAGNFRRWLPVRCGVAGAVDVDGVVRDCEQLWAEGAALWRAGGVDWRRAQDLGVDEHDQFTIEDEWRDMLGAWVDQPVEPEIAVNGSHVESWRDRGFTTLEALQVGLKMGSGANGSGFRGREERVANSLKMLGFNKKKSKTRDELRDKWVWRSDW